MANDSLIYIDDNGLHVPIKSEIKEDLNNMAKQAFGSDFATDDGSEFDVFLDLLSNCLASFSCACKDVFNSFNATTATGIALDNLCSLVGIQRYENEADAHLRYRYINSAVSESSSNKLALISKLLKVNIVDDNEIVGKVSYANIYDNSSEGNESIKLHYNNSQVVLPHSIAVFVQYDINEEKYADDMKNEIATCIHDYKTLGCSVGLSDESNALQNKQEGICTNDKTVTVEFLKVVNVNLKFSITLKSISSLSSNQKSSISDSLKNKMFDVIDKLDPYTNVQYYDILNCVFNLYDEFGLTSKDFILSSISAYKYNDGLTNIGALDFGINNDIEILLDEKANVNVKNKNEANEEIDIIINWS
jgi:hypothetical protein